MGKGRFCCEFAVKTNKIMDLNTVKTVVVKIGTSTLTYENGKMNLRRIDKLCRTLCDLQNGGRRAAQSAEHSKQQRSDDGDAFARRAAFGKREPRG